MQQTQNQKGIVGRPKGHRAACNCAVCCTARLSVDRKEDQRIRQERRDRRQEQKRQVRERRAEYTVSQVHEDLGYVYQGLRWCPFAEALSA